MAATIEPVEYFYATVRATPGGGYETLAHLAEQGVNLLAFSAIPVGPDVVQLVLFPESVERLVAAAEKSHMVLTGPQRAFLIQGDDKLGALASIHATLYDARIDVYASSGVTDGRGGFGYVVYVRPDDFEAAAQALARMRE
jgi:hypothetical protein